MPVLVTGSVAIDTVTTPHGRAENVLGGSATYFALAAAHYAPVRVVAAVGRDFPAEFRRLLESRRIDLSGLETRDGSSTFRWTGRFEGDMNVAETVDVQLNVLAEAAPPVPAAFADSDTVFLANTHPTRQVDVLTQLRKPRLVVCDTMNLWIATERDALVRTLGRVHGAIVNDGEARLLTGRTNLMEAGEAILSLGPQFVIIKKGEHGSVLVTRDGVFAMPAYPARDVRDPTGAGDSFAGGVVGYLAHAGRHDTEALRRAMARGTVAASFTIEDFSMRRLHSATRDEVDQRVRRFIEMMRLD